MKFTANPVSGTFDVLPKEMEIRNWIRDTISNVYENRGFLQIETPCIENLPLLTNSEGGENLRLIFKILKRGEKLNFEELTENALCDLGLRYDLTLPLSRFYASNQNELPMPFKAFQMGYVWRAERPQKGRFRQFTQCDIDIIGEKSIYAEIELLLTVPKALYALGFKNFTVKINDRRLLKILICEAGFNEENFESICITLDKADKIGQDGVVQELIGKGFEKQGIEQLLNNLNTDIFSFDNEYASELQKIIKNISKYYPIEFDPTLVRGMGYYTGPIFEIVSDEFKGSIAGGGRYDDLLSKFQKSSVPAVGISIGFERIFAILKEKSCETPFKKKKVAIIVTNDEYLERAVELGEELDNNQNAISIYKVNRNKLGKRIHALEKQGFEEIIVVDDEQNKNS